MTTSELLVQAARRIGFGGGTLGSDRRLYEVLLQEADRLDGLNKRHESTALGSDIDMSIELSPENEKRFYTHLRKPKPEKLKEVELTNRYDSRGKALNTLIRDYNERKGL